MTTYKLINHFFLPAIWDCLFKPFFDHLDVHHTNLILAVSWPQTPMTLAVRCPPAQWFPLPSLSRPHPPYQEWTLWFQELCPPQFHLHSPHLSPQDRLEPLWVNPRFLHSGVSTCIQEYSMCFWEESFKNMVKTIFYYSL